MKKNNKGFTLIEVIISLSIIGLLFTVVITQINKQDIGQELKDNKAMMVNVLQLARNYAVSGHECSDCGTDDTLYGFGLVADTSISDQDYNIYADINNDQKYDNGTDYLVEKFLLEDDVYIVSCNDGTECDVFFDMYTGQSGLSANYDIVLGHKDDIGGVTETITIDYLTSKIE